MPLAHWLRVTTCGSGAAASEPMTSATWNQAMRVRSTNARRAAGSTFGSDAPPVAPSWANCRAGVPVQRPLVLQRLGEVTEHGQGREEVVRPSLRLIGRGVVGHAPEPTGWPGAAVRERDTVERVALTRAVGDDEAAPTRVHVTGAEGSLARRVLAALAGNERVVDGSATASDVVVHLGAGDHDRRARRRENVTDGAAVMLEDATVGGAAHIVLVSSALVYGAYANNPVPLTEDAILRPDVDFVYARQLATVEAMVDRWRRDGPGRTVTVLRPVVAMAADGTPSLAAALAAGFGQQLGADDPPAQFLHLDDLASAVALAVDGRLDGVFNVAPDGWVAGERVRALTGARPRIRLPDRVAGIVAALRWRFQRGPIPPGLRSYTREPWLVANDRLKAQGWRPTITNEQAYVEGTEARWWTMITPKRRQELTLGAMAVATVAVATGVVTLARSWRRRRR